MTDIRKTIEHLKHELDQNSISSDTAANKQAKSVEIMARTLLLMFEHLTSTGTSDEEKKIGYILGGKR